MMREVNRCSGCRRKVGLAGFRCRCGELFCADHRYSDRHDCSYYYKATGREAIARENPVVKAGKIFLEYDGIIFSRNRSYQSLGDRDSISSSGWLGRRRKFRDEGIQRSIIATTGN